MMRSGKRRKLSRRMKMHSRRYRMPPDFTFISDLRKRKKIIRKSRSKNLSNVLRCANVVLILPARTLLRMKIFASRMTVDISSS